MTTSRIIILISAAILILCAAGTGFYWLPKVQAYFAAEQQLASVDVQLEQKLQYFSKLKETAKELESYKEPLSRIDSAFPVDPNVSVPPLIVYMLKVTAESGVTVKDVNIGTELGEVQNNGLSEIKFDLAGTAASYSVFKNLLTNIYGNVRMIDVDQISLTAPEFKKEEPEPTAGKSEAPQEAKEEYQFTMSLRANFYPETQLVQNPDAPEASQ